MSRASPADSSRPPWRVFVAGFADWPASSDAAAGFDAWRCRDNPSGYLLLGRWHDGGSAPAAGDGPLCARLRSLQATDDGRPIAWSFSLLPVTWEVGATMPIDDQDVVVNIGLGVYDDETTILVERGAVNRRGAKCDAGGRIPGDTGQPPIHIDDEVDATLVNVDEAGIVAIAGPRNVDGVRYEVVAAPLREDNDYVCNETHFLALARMRRHEPPGRAYFVHIPRPSDTAGYARLAEVLAEVIEQLVRPV